MAPEAITFRPACWIQSGPHAAFAAVTTLTPKAAALSGRSLGSRARPSMVTRASASGTWGATSWRGVGSWVMRASRIPDAPPLSSNGSRADASS